MTIGGEAPPVHDVQRGTALVAEGLSLALGARAWTRSQREVRDDLTELWAQRNRLDAALLHLVRASVAGDNGQDPGRETRQWLQATLRLTAGQARAMVEAAVAADPEDGELRELGQALSAGDVSREHVDQARRALEKLPVRARADHREQIGEVLTSSAQSLTSHQLGTVCQHLVATLAPSGQDHLDPFLRERRHLDYSFSRAGVLRGTFLLEGIDAATTKSVLDHLSAPGRDEPSDTEALPGTQDTRSLTQRRADALAAAFRLASAAEGVGTRGGEPPHLLVHTTVEQLASHPALLRQQGQGSDAADRALAPGLAQCDTTGPLSPALLQRAACDAVLQVVVRDGCGAVVELRTPYRLANRAQRRALAARDRGCAWPGCGVPAAGCDAHHVVLWSRGGRTELGNLVLLCPRHHTEIHAEEWRVTVQDGLPWFIPPRWVDPDQRPVRNSLHDHVEAAERLAQQLSLDLPPTDPDLSFGPGPPGTDVTDTS